MKLIESEKCWKKIRSIYQLNGIKTLYRCNVTRFRGVAGIYTIHSVSPDDESYSLYRKTGAHNHETSTNIAKRLSVEVKKMIEEGIEDRLTLKTILHKIRGKGEIVQPEKNQVANYIKTYRKKTIW